MYMKKPHNYPFPAAAVVDQHHKPTQAGSSTIETQGLKKGSVIKPMIARPKPEVFKNKFHRKLDQMQQSYIEKLKN